MIQNMLGLFSSNLPADSLPSPIGHSDDGYNYAARAISAVGNTFNSMRTAGARRSMTEDSVTGFDQVPLPKRRKIKASLVKEATRRDMPILAAAGTALYYRSSITNSSIFTTAKEFVKSIPTPIQYGLSSHILTVGASLQKYIKDRMDYCNSNMNFLLNFNNQIPPHLKNVISFHALNEAFEQHGDKLPIEIRAAVLGKLSEVESQVNQSGGVFSHDAFNKEEPLRYGPQAYPNIGALLDSVAPVLAAAAQKERVSKVFEPLVLEAMVKDFSAGTAAVLKKIFSNLLIPASSVARPVNLEDIQKFKQIKTTDELVSALTKLLVLTPKNALALERMIEFHQAKADIDSVKNELNTGAKQSEELLAQINSVSIAHGACPTGSPESLELEQKHARLYCELDRVYPVFPKETIEQLDRLSQLADAALLANSGDEYDLASFLEPDKKLNYIQLNKFDTGLMTPGNIRSIATRTHVLDISKGIQQLLSIGKKPIKKFELTGAMKADIEALLTVLDEKDRPLFLQKLHSVETLSSPYIPYERKAFDIKPSVYLEGSPGIGKTTLLRKLAQLTGLDVIDIKADITVENLTKNLVDCPSKNPMFIIDEAGEALSRDAFLDSLCRWLIDKDSPKQEGQFDGHIPIDLSEAVSRSSFWMTGNEEIKSEKIKSRTTVSKMPGSSETVKRERAMAGYEAKVGSSGRRLIANDQKALMLDLFKNDIEHIINKTSDLRAITELAGYYAVHQLSYFEKNFDKSIEQKKNSWQIHASTQVLPNLNQVAINKGAKKSVGFLDRPPRLPMTRDYSSMRPSREYSMTAGSSVDFDSIFKTQDSFMMAPPLRLSGIELNAGARNQNIYNRNSLDN